MCYTTLLDGLLHGTTGFVGMRAVVETATASCVEQFAKVMAHFFAAHVECAEAFYSRNVDYRAALLKKIHTAVGCGVHSGKVRFGYLRCLCSCVRYKRVDKGRFPGS